MKLTVVSHPAESGLGGGARREFFAIREFLNYVDIELYFPFRSIVECLFLSQTNERVIGNVIKSLEELQNKGLKVPSNIFYFLENELLLEKIKNILSRYKVQYVLNIENIKNYEILLIKTLLGKGEIKPENSKFIYSPHEPFEFVFPAYYLSKKADKNVSILLQEAPFFRITHFHKLLRYNKFSALVMNYYGRKNKKLIIELIKRKRLNNILAVSRAPILLSKIDNYFKDYKVLKIGNAFDESLLKYRKFKKKDYLVFFARLTPEKGIFEIPYVVKEIKKECEDIITYVIGSFKKVEYKMKFLKLVKKLKLEGNIILKGFLEEKELNNIVSKAKALLYPSHQDAFPLVVLESLALGTSVVAYDIPAIVYIYRNLKPVKIVREGNTKEMAKKTIEILNQDKKEYITEHKDKVLEDFLRVHSSWKNVAIEELRKLGLKI